MQSHYGFSLTRLFIGAEPSRAYPSPNICDASVNEISVIHFVGFKCIKRDAPEPCPAFLFETPRMWYLLVCFGGNRVRYTWAHWVCAHRNSPTVDNLILMKAFGRGCFLPVHSRLLSVELLLLSTPIDAQWLKQPLLCRPWNTIRIFRVGCFLEAVRLWKGYRYYTPVWARRIVSCQRWLVSQLLERTIRCLTAQQWSTCVLISFVVWVVAPSRPPNRDLFSCFRSHRLTLHHR